MRSSVVNRAPWPHVIGPDQDLVGDLKPRGTTLPSYASIRNKIPLGVNKLSLPASARAGIGSRVLVRPLPFDTSGLAWRTVKSTGLFFVGSTFEII
jgi:hypothetical protein